MVKIAKIVSVMGLVVAAGCALALARRSRH